MSKPARTNPTRSDNDPIDTRDDTPRIAIVGFGLSTPLGDGAWPTMSALLAGKTLADRAGDLPPDTAPLDLARALGCGATVQHTRADPAVLLAERTIREAVTMAQITADNLPLYLGTSKGAIAKLARALEHGRPLDPDNARCVALGPHAYLAEQLDKRLHTQRQTHHVAACSSGLVALDAARRSLLHRKTNASPYAIVASADAAITPLFLASYQRLGVLGSVTADRYTQRPLDESRVGFMLSEIGACVLLKRVEPDEPWPHRAIHLVDTATACEPYDMVRSPSEMQSLAGLWSRLSRGRQIDVIHPHAPGTRDHDPAELSVLLRPLKPAEPPTTADNPTHTTPNPTPVPSGQPDLYAVKGAIGHGLGASGLASLVVAALCLRCGKRPPMPWLTHPMKLPDGQRLRVDPLTQPCRNDGTHAVLAAGFGGHLAGAILRGIR